jgi:hypothetical protein
MGVTGVMASISLTDGLGVTFSAISLALPVTMLVALLAALSVAARASGAVGPLVRSAGRSGRAAPPVVTGCAIAVVALLMGATNVALIAAVAMAAVSLPGATSALVEIFSSTEARQRLYAALAAGASPQYVALIVHLRASLRSVAAIALRTAARMGVDSGVIVVALVGAGSAERAAASATTALDVSALPFAAGQFFAAAVAPGSHEVLLRAASLVVFVLVLHGAARLIEGEPFRSMPAR